MQPVPVTTFRRDSFAPFVRDYLAKASGTISKMFDSYGSDVRLRLEDMPWALVELFESLGVPKAMQDRVIELEKQKVSPQISKWEPHLFQRVLESEAVFCADLDYY